MVHQYNNNNSKESEPEARKTVSAHVNDMSEYHSGSTPVRFSSYFFPLLLSHLLCLSWALSYHTCFTYLSCIDVVYLAHSYLLATHTDSPPDHVLRPLVWPVSRRRRRCSLLRSPCRVHYVLVNINVLFNASQDPGTASS